MVVYHPSRSFAPSVVPKLATICLSTPDNSAVECLTVPYVPLTIAGAVIRFAAAHGLGAAQVEMLTLSVTPSVQAAA